MQRLGISAMRASEQARACAVFVRGCACVPCIVFIVVRDPRPSVARIKSGRGGGAYGVFPPRARSWIPFRVIGVQATFKPHKCASGLVSKWCAWAAAGRPLGGQTGRACVVVSHDNTTRIARVEVTASAA